MHQVIGSNASMYPRRNKVDDFGTHNMHIHSVQLEINVDASSICLIPWKEHFRFNLQKSQELYMTTVNL